MLAGTRAGVLNSSSALPAQPKSLPVQWRYEVDLQLSAIKRIRQRKSGPTKGPPQSIC
jgi:hypothetical protein